MALVQPRKGLAAAGVALGAWVMCGAVAELLDRVRAGKASSGESVRRLKGLPRGAWGTTLAHFGVGLFIVGACLEPSWKTENAQVLAPGQSLSVAGYQVRLDKVGTVDGPNYSAERAQISATRNGQPACSGEPEKRTFFDAGGQPPTSHVMLCLQGLSDLYVVLGDARTLTSGAQGWLVTAHWNPWARLIWLGPFLMAFGGLVSLSDRRLRFALPRRARAPAAGLAPEPAE
jgi:cytochrome c-type biogenesis protein CcmF